MNTTQATYPISLLVLAIGVIALSAWALQSRKDAKDMQEALALAKEQQEADSLLLMRYASSDDALSQIIAAYDSVGFPQGEGHNLATLLDAMLKRYASNNDQLRQQAEQRKKVIAALENSIASLRNKAGVLENTITTLEEHKSLSEEEWGRWQSEWQAQAKEKDSLYAVLAALQQELRTFGLDSVGLVSPNGHKFYFYGKLVNQSPEGFGIGFYEGRGYYIGEWKGNARHGRGKHHYKDGSAYEGYFEDDFRQGYGTYYYSTGEIFKGHWQKDLMHGEGKIAGTDGKAISGIWEKGKLLQKR